MSELTLSPAPRTEAEYKAAIEALFDEMDRMHARMEQDQARIERSKRELQKIKAETAVIKARTQARLDALEKMV